MSDDDFDPATATEEELTLWLARNGHSPEDTRRSLARIMERLEQGRKDAEEVRKATPAVTLPRGTFKGGAR